MPPSYEKYCPACAGSLPMIATLCAHCGQDLCNDAYTIVPDGVTFGIAFKDRIVIHELELKEAMEVASIMNGSKR